MGDWKLIWVIWLGFGRRFLSGWGRFAGWRVYACGSLVGDMIPPRVGIACVMNCSRSCGFPIASSVCLRSCSISCALIALCAKIDRDAFSLCTAAFIARDAFWFASLTSLFSWMKRESCMSFSMRMGLCMTAFRIASMIDLLFSGNGIEIPIDLRISCTFLRMISRTIPSMGLSLPYRRVVLMVDAGCPNLSTRPSRCSSLFGFQGRS